MMRAENKQPDLVEGRYLGTLIRVENDSSGGFKNKWEERWLGTMRTHKFFKEFCVKGRREMGWY